MPYGEGSDVTCSSKPEARYPGRPPASGPKCILHHLLGFAHDRLQMGLVLEALGVDLVDVFRAGGPGRKPAAFGHYLQTPDGSMIAGSLGQLSGDRFARKIRLFYRIRRELLKFRLL